MGNKIALKHVPGWSIIRLLDGRLGVTPDRPTKGKYTVSLHNRHGVVLEGTTEVEIVKYPAQIAMEALGKL